MIGGRRATGAAGAVAAAMVIVGSVASSALIAGTAVADSPAPSSAGSTPRVQIVLGDLEPRVVRPHATLTISGIFTNTSGEPLQAVSYSLRASSQRITTRYDLAHDADPSTAVGLPVNSTRHSVGTVAPGASVTWQLSVPVQRLGLPASVSEFGAYPIAIEVRSSLHRRPATVRLPTTLMWMPDGAQLAPTRVSWLWPLVDGVHRGADPTHVDSSLARDLAPTGRLGRLLATAATTTTPLTFVVDPALVDDAEALATSTDAGASTAAAWLTQLRDVVRKPGSALLGLPYGDADLAALEHAGLDREIGIARSTGQAVLANDLAPSAGTTALTNVVWPIDGVIDETTLDDLPSTLADTVVLSDKALPARDSDALTGNRADLQTPSGTIHAVLSDSAIDNLVFSTANFPGGLRAEEQRFLAETMLITEQRPGLGSSLVITPPRGLDPHALSVAAALAATTSVPWLKPVTLPAVEAEQVDGVARLPLVYPASERHSELSSVALRAVLPLRAQLAALNAVIGANTSDPFINEANVAITRAESAAFRHHTAASIAITATIGNSLDKLSSQVYISNPRLITLTSRHQKIPITVINNLPETVTVSLRVSAVNPDRLHVTPLGPITAAGKGARTEILVDVEAPTSGRFDVQAQLMTPGTDGQPYGQPVSFQLNSTAYGTVALVIAGAAAGLLLALSVFRVTRRIVRARRATSAPNPPNAAGAAAAEPPAAEVADITGSVTPDPHDASLPR